MQVIVKLKMAATVKVDLPIYFFTFKADDLDFSELFFVIFGKKGVLFLSSICFVLPYRVFRPKTQYSLNYSLDPVAQKLSPVVPIVL